MKFDELRWAMDLAMGETLKNSGFQRFAPGSWSRLRNEDINVVHLQKRTSDNLFCINLGVHYDFLPKIGTETLFDPDKIEISDCELKFRLTDDNTAKDQWWPMIESSINSSIDALRRCGLPIFDRYKFDGPISSIDETDIERENASLLASIPKVRAFLFLSRMHERLGNREKCVEAANIGIASAGMAIGPKVALRNILRRIEAQR